MTTHDTPEAMSGTICKCGLAKSYHPRLANHEYEPRYPTRDTPEAVAARAAKAEYWAPVIAAMPHDTPEAALHPKRRVLICACGHDQFSHNSKVGPYLLCSSPGCRCADANYVRSEERP